MFAALACDSNNEMVSGETTTQPFPRGVDECPAENRSGGQQPAARARATVLGVGQKLLEES